MSPTGTMRGERTAAFGQTPTGARTMREQDREKRQAHDEEDRARMKILKVRGMEPRLWWSRIKDCPHQPLCWCICADGRSEASDPDTQESGRRKASRSGTSLKALAAIYEWGPQLTTIVSSMLIATVAARACLCPGKAA
jgi:hypothetical protein